MMTAGNTILLKKEVQLSDLRADLARSALESKTSLGATMTAALAHLVRLELEKLVKESGSTLDETIVIEVYIDHGEVTP